MADKNKNNKVEDEEIEEEDQNETSVIGKHNTGAADLAKMSGLGLEDDDNHNVNTKDISSAMSLIDSNRSKDEAERAAKKKELEKVKIRKEDVEFIMQEMELTKTEAEFELRFASGDLVQALINVINE